MASHSPNSPFDPYLGKRKNQSALLFGFALIALLLNLLRLHRAYDRASFPSQNHGGWADLNNVADFNIFYHIFFPTDPNRREEALAIVEEQIRQIGSSNPPENGRTTVFYNTVAVGEENPLSHTFMNQLCESNGIHCEHMHHYEGGNEYLTLSNGVYKFCQSVPDKSTRVAYIHSKGSFHPKSTNTNWRQNLMMAVLSEECWKPKDETCNVCGLHFFPLWTFFLPGNFWTARCSYINTLLPLNDYEIKLSETTQKVAKTDIIPRTLYPWQEDTLGKGRYSAEHWIGSSPDLVPCDLAQTIGLSRWKDGVHNKEELLFAMAPRFPFNASWYMLNPRILSEVLNSSDGGRYEFFFLAGHLIKWKALYDRLPTDDSWVWSYFPYGDKWQEDVRSGVFDSLYTSIMVNNTGSSRT